MNKLKLVLLLTLLTAIPAAAAPLITLPDSNVYYYWFRSAAGAINHAPVSTTSGKIDIASHQSAGGTVYILDPHSGGIAVVPVASAATGTTVTVDDFHVPPVPASSAAAPTTTTSSAAPAQSTPAPPADQGPSIASRIVTTIIGIAVFGGVVWFIRSLVMTRGQLLIDTARRVGVEVPNPDELPQSDIKVDGKYEPPPVVRVQAVPEEALKPLKKPSSGGYLIADNGTAYGVGSKTLSIGRDSTNDIVLVDTSVSRRHARVESVGNVVTLFDENSANGVFVNSLRIEQQALTPGDRIHIGRIPLRYEK